MGKAPTVISEDLNALMEFDRVIQVHKNGQVSEPLDAPCYPSLQDNELDSPKWEFFSVGYTGQDRYDGPIMHDSELIDGALADDILSKPGLYVAVVSYYTEEEEDTGHLINEPSGWAIVRYVGDGR